MFFPLLESLLQRNSELCKAHVHDFLQSAENPNLIFKSLLTYAAQQDTADTRNDDAVVVCEALASLVLSETVETDKRESFIGRVLEFLCAMPTEPVDTSVLKPLKGETKVVSIFDLEEAFEQNDINVMVATVKDILTLMDNKRYFMEIMMNMALSKSASTVILTQATSHAIEIMDWKNNFTPFLIYHLIKKVFLDRHHEVLTENCDDTIFREIIGRIHSREGIQLVSACYQIASESKIIRNKLNPKAARRARNYVENENAALSVLEQNVGISNLCVVASLRRVSAFPESEILMSKFAL